MGCSYDTLTHWIKQHLEDRLSYLVSPITHQKPNRLSAEQQQQLKVMVRQMWTGAILSQVMAQRFDVELKDSRIYELLEKLGLSYQRAHRDYASADPIAQQEWVEIGVIEASILLANSSEKNQS